MPKGINPIRKALLKENLLKGKSIRQSMKDAGYSERTAHGNCDKNEPLVKSCIAELQEEFKASDITVDYILAKLKKEVENAKNASDRIAALSWLGKYQAMFRDRSEVDVTTHSEETQELSRLRGMLLPATN